jgi:pSer/pThr/pTyr-binding forkhead associated (FHA) protein
MASLSVIRKPKTMELGAVQPAEMIVLRNEKTMIGRHPPEQGIDLQLPVFAVNRQHALITRSQGAYWIEDFGSRNGTYLGQTLISDRARLYDGDEIRICDFVLLFRDDATSPRGNPVDPANGA